MTDSDPVILAALELAEILDRTHRQLVTGKPIRMYGLSGPEGQAALDAYRAAKEAKEPGVGAPGSTSRLTTTPRSEG